MANKNKNKKKNRFIFRVIVLIVLAAATVFALYSTLTKDDQEVIQEGDQAPNFQLKTVNMEQDTLSLGELEGKGVMLNFWGTWCPPCKEEMPYMQELYPEYKEKGVEIVAVSLDDSRLVIEDFLNEYGLTFPILHDKTYQVNDTYGVGYLPATFFINEDGEVVNKVVGGLTLEKLEGHLQEIVPES